MFIIGAATFCFLTISHSHISHTPHSSGLYPRLPGSSPLPNMQPEASAPDPSAVGASSPPITPFRHPQPLTAADNDHDRLRLRRQLSPSTISLHIKTPYAELGATQPISWDVPASLSVGAAKDALADGSAGYGTWEREGMRLICRGRMLDDFEVLGRALPRGETPTLHLVARPSKSSAPPPSITEIPAPTSSTPSNNNEAAPTSASATAPSPAPQPSATATALADTIHYLLFAAREHLCALLGTQNLAWEDMYPAPTVERREAREAVASVLRSLAPGAGWEAVLEGDDGDLESVWTSLTHKGMLAEVESLWKSATGRLFAAEGDSTAVEFDERPVTLHLPPLKAMVPSQLTHLLLYLRITVLLPHLNQHLQAAQAPPPTPSPPHPAPAHRASHSPVRVRVIYRPGPGVGGLLQSLSMTLLIHAFWSAFRILLIIFMLGRNLSWTDGNFWLMLAAGGAWWIFDAYSTWLAERRQERIRLRAERAMEEREGRRRRERGAAGGAAGGPGYVVREYGADGELQPTLGDEAEQDLREPRELQIPRDPRDPRDPREPRDREARGVRDLRDLQREERERERERRRAARRSAAREGDWARVALYNLDVDNRQLRLPSSVLDTPPVVNGMPGPTPVPELRRAPSTRPGWFKTRVLLPLYLWVLTLVPDFEMRRARAIRQRERAIRALVTERRQQIDRQQPQSQRGQQGQQGQGGQGQGQQGGNGEHGTHGAQNSLWLPEGISPIARKYYERVVARPESIDWDEEREAQRALGLPDEEQEEERFVML